MLLLMASVLGVEALENPQSGKISPPRLECWEAVLEVLEREMELQEFLSEDSADSSWLAQEMLGEAWLSSFAVVLLVRLGLSLATSSFCTAAQWMLHTRLDFSLSALCWQVSGCQSP